MEILKHSSNEDDYLLLLTEDLENISAVSCCTCSCCCSCGDGP
jgi:hypothetical protein